MERLVKGDIVIVSYPFSTQEVRVRRPAIVVAKPSPEDVILVPVTTRHKEYTNRVFLPKTGKLKEDSYVRPERLISMHSRKIYYRIGKVSHLKLEEIVNAIVRIIRKE